MYSKHSRAIRTAGITLESELLWAKAGKYLFFVLIVYVATAILHIMVLQKAKPYGFSRPAHY